MQIKILSSDLFLTTKRKSFYIREIIFIYFLVSFILISNLIQGGLELKVRVLVAAAG